MTELVKLMPTASVSVAKKLEHLALKEHLGDLAKDSEHARVVDPDALLEQVHHPFVLQGVRDIAVVWQFAHQ